MAIESAFLAERSDQGRFQDPMLSFIDVGRVPTLAIDHEILSLQTTSRHNIAWSGR